MPSKQNITCLSQLTDSLSRSKAMVLADYKGLNVKQLTNLRKTVEASGGELKVNKNTLVKLAFKAGNYPLADVEADLAGPTATIFSYNDEVSVIKAVADFAKEAGLPKIKSGFLGLEFLSAKRMLQLANLPDKLTLQAQVIGMLNSPLSGLACVLQGNIRKFVYVLEAIKKTKN